jgi:hypothetical protein
MEFSHAQLFSFYNQVNFQLSGMMCWYAYLLYTVSITNEHILVLLRPVWDFIGSIQSRRASLQT